jgi:hypothetical protein
MYKPMVAEMDMTISRKIAFENKSVNVAPLLLSAETCCTPLIVKKTAANYRKKSESEPTPCGLTHRHVKSKDCETDKGEGVTLVRALRAITEREDETSEQKADVGILEDGVENLDPLSADYSRVLKGIRQHEERDEEVSL